MDIYIDDIVFHKNVYNGREPLKVVGIRKDELELEGDYSGGTHNVCQKCWLPIDGVKQWSVIISGFPGVGKTTFQASDYAPERFCLDSDSSSFDKSKFPENYIKHIKSKIGKYKFILTSSHIEVRASLQLNKMPFVLVYPEINLKYEYLHRYIDRGSSDSFVKLLDENWSNWIDSCKKQSGCTHIVLGRNEYLSNVNFDKHGIY